MSAPGNLLPILLLLLLAGLAAGGCTLQRIGDDTSQTFEWLGLKHGAALTSGGRWQLPRNVGIHVEELAPAPNPGWLDAARQGVNEVFPAGNGARRDFTLEVRWPQPGDGDGNRYLLAFQSRFTVQVTLVRSADGALVDAARLDVSPRWLSAPAAAPVRNAFRELAASYRPGH